MGVKKSDLVEEEPRFSYLGPWHANLIYIDGKKCVLFVNNRTLFNFIAPDVSRVQIRELNALFKDGLKNVLAGENLEDAIEERICAEYAEVAYGNANNRSVLGSMNDLASHYKFHILREGGISSPAIPSIISRLNRMPMGAIGHGYPIEALRAMYQIVN